MAQLGFIRDKLEIKFLILYIAAHVAQPIPFETVQELTMCDDAIDFFDFSECVSDLVQTEHLTLSSDGLYGITEKGLRNSRICESSLPYSVRIRADKNLAVCNQQLRRRAQVKSAVAPRANGTFTVTLSLSDEAEENIFHLEMMVPKEDMARDLERRFQKNAEQLYGDLIHTLYDVKKETDE